jgi:thermitase
VRYITFALLLSVLASVASAATGVQFVVRFKAGTNPSALATKYKISLASVIDHAPFALYDLPAGTNAGALQTQMAADPSVVWVEDNTQIGTAEGIGTKGSTLPAIGGRSKEIAKNTNVLTQINWSSDLANMVGRPMKIAIMDTGLSKQQTFLWNRVSASANFIESGQPADDKPLGNDTNGNTVVDEAVGHGTMVASIVNMITPQSRLVIAKVADSDGIATAWTVIEGLAFAVVHGAEVANLSVGSQDQVLALSDVMDWCEQHNLVVVAGAGNDNLSHVSFPSRISKIVCVTGLDANNKKASFSNYDSAADSTAPATGIVGEWWDGHMGVWSGTSFSSPMVAASIADALRRTSGPVSAATMRSAVTDSGKDIDGMNPTYSGKLGTLIDFTNLGSLIASRP